MTCSLPLSLTDDQLSAVLDGVADTAILEHVAHCVGCAKRIDEAKKFEQELSRRLRRSDCPPAQQLAHYHMGMLDINMERVISSHLEYCVLCKADIEDLQLFLTANIPAHSLQPTLQRLAPTPIRRRHEIFAQILPRTPAIALRGSAVRPITAEVAGITIFMDVQLASDNQVTINGQIVADDQEHWIGALVEFRQTDTVQAVAVVDDLGGFQCGPLPTSQIDLRITAEGGAAVVMYNIALTA